MLVLVLASRVAMAQPVRPSGSHRLHHFRQPHSGATKRTSLTRESRPGLLAWVGMTGCANPTPSGIAGISRRNRRSSLRDSRKNKSFSAFTFPNESFTMFLIFYFFSTSRETNLLREGVTRMKYQVAPRLKYFSPFIRNYHSTKNRRHRYWTSTFLKHNKCEIAKHSRSTVISSLIHNFSPHNTHRSHRPISKANPVVGQGRIALEIVIQ